MRLKWYRFHDNRVYELYSMLIDPDTEETVLDRLNHMPSRIVVNYPGAAINGKVRIEYWKAQEYAQSKQP